MRLELVDARGDTGTGALVRTRRLADVRKIHGPALRERVAAAGLDDALHEGLEVGERTEVAGVGERRVEDGPLVLVAADPVRDGKAVRLRLALGAGVHVDELHDWLLVFHACFVAGHGHLHLGRQRIFRVIAGLHTEVFARERDGVSEVGCADRLDGHDLEDRAFEHTGQGLGLGRLARRARVLAAPFHLAAHRQGIFHHVDERRLFALRGLLGGDPTFDLEERAARRDFDERRRSLLFTERLERLCRHTPALLRFARARDLERDGVAVEVHGDVLLKRVVVELRVFERGVLQRRDLVVVEGDDPEVRQTVKGRGVDGRDLVVLQVDVHEGFVGGEELVGDRLELVLVEEQVLQGFGIADNGVGDRANFVAIEAQVFQLEQAFEGPPG